jgi:phage terminase large subunit-like protein
LNVVYTPAERANRVIEFIETYCYVPEGTKVGEKLVLEEFQKKFIREVYGNKHGTRRAYLAMARKNGKTALIAALLLASICGPEAKLNSQILSGAMSRDQAALVFALAEKMIYLNPDLEAITKIVPSSKRIHGLTLNTEYRASSADASTAHGSSPILIIADEVGQVRGPSSDFYDALETSQGAHDAPLFIAISTQAASDVDMFSVWLDDAERSEDPHIVSHVYKADDGCDLMDEEQWYKANPALGVFRNYDDLKNQLDQAQRMPTRESSARNLLLNERISMDVLAFPPSVWKRCAGEIDFELFRRGPVHMGLDLSARNDLTAAVLCAEDDDGIVHVLPYVFCPTSGIEDRSRRDRAPYDLWVREGKMVPVGGQTMDFDQIAEALNDELSEIGIQVTTIQYDKHMITHFQAACERAGVFQDAEWVGVPQFFKDMGARLASLTGLMVDSKLRHGGHPVLTMAASVAVAKAGREGVSALAKNLSTQRIDAVVALTMACWPFGDGRESIEEFSIEQWVV